MIGKEEITAIVLCGGRGSRLENQDKPLLRLGDQRIIEWLEHSLNNQVTELLISGSRNVAIYESLGHKVIVDSEIEKGPLVGLNSAFSHVQTEWVLTTPGDTPFISEGLVSMLSAVAEQSGVAVPLVHGIRQNLCLLINRSRRKQLSSFFEAGGTAVKYWLDTVRDCEVDLSDHAKSFFNINTLEDLNQASKLSTQLSA